MLRLVVARLAKAGVVTLIAVVICAIVVAVTALIVLWLLFPNGIGPDDDGARNDYGVGGP